MNAKRFQNRWPVSVGLARAYAISGVNKQAVAWPGQRLRRAACLRPGF
jgi:hypothetical protein